MISLQKRLFRAGAGATSKGGDVAPFQTAVPRGRGRDVHQNGALVNILRLFRAGGLAAFFGARVH